MKKLKCPRCKKALKKEDTFCTSCGNPMGTKKDVVSTIDDKNKTILQEETIGDNQTIDNKKLIIKLLSSIIVILIIVLLCVIFLDEEKECICVEQDPNVEIKYIEKEPTIQYINYLGYRFSMPLDWNFEGDDQDYKFINGEETIYVSISNIDTVDYETFVSDDYQKIYLEELQTNYDISINRKEEKTQNEKNYYLMEGVNNSYEYMIIVTKNDNGIFLIETQFENNSIYNNKKQEVIDFALSYMKNNKI